MAALCAAALSMVVVGAAAGGGGNSASAKFCQKNGWQFLVGTNGAFASEAACTSYGAKGGIYVTTGQFIPAGQRVTFSNAAIGDLGAQAKWEWGYQVTGGSNVTLGTKAEGGSEPVTGTPTTVGPFKTAAVLRVFLRDLGLPSFGAPCDLTFYSDGPNGLVTGSGTSSSPWHVSINDSGGACTTTPFEPPADGDSNFVVTVTLS